ncbi:MAG: hypothetical protein ACYDEJ_04785 [Desulfitobacteriaceae bacterium]
MNEMYLGEQDAILFYKSWMMVLEFINQKYQVIPGLTKMVNATMLNPQEVLQIRNKLWDDETLLEEYIHLYGKSLTIREFELIKSWKNKLVGRFILLKHLKKYSVFMQEDMGGKLYGVLGISNPIGDMFPPAKLPIYVDAVLMPFEGKIIYDSFLIAYRIQFGSNIKRRFREDYRKIKEKDGIITMLS